MTAPGSPSVRQTPYLNAFWNNATLVTVRRDDSGRVVMKQLPAEYSTFVRTADATKNIDMMRAFRSSRHCVGIGIEGDWTRIRWGTRDHAIAASRFIEAQYKVQTFEGDVLPQRRWMIDNDVQIARPRRVYLDIETDSRVPFSRMTEARILCWSLVDDEGNAVSASLTVDTDAAERELLRALWVALEPFDQIIGWNLDRFDKPMILARTEARGLRVESRRWLWLDHLVLFKRMNMSAAESGDEKQSLSLEAVAQSVLHKGKLEGLSGRNSWDLWSGGPEARAKLEIYCRNDADLMRLIEEVTGYIELLHTLCEVTHVFPDTWGIRPTAQVDAFLLRLGRDRGMHFVTHFETDDVGDQFGGAYVMEPKFRGIARDVHVADFSAMYPSIILTWNMSPETHRPNVRLRESDEGRPSYLSHLPLREFPLPAGHCRTATDVVFTNEPRGLLAIALEEMLRLRKYWNDKKASLPPGTPEWKEADRRSMAYKIAANSFYGVVGSPFSRHFVREVAQAVSQAGVWLIKETIEAAEAGEWIRELDGPTVALCKMKVGYADTDSIFVAGVDRETFGRFVGWCNSHLYPRILVKMGCPPERNRVKIAYEKAFSRVVFASKKRYAAKFLHYKGADATADSKLEIKGLEFKRGDTARLTRELQAEVVELVIKDGVDDIEAIAEVLNRWKRRILEGELGRDDVFLSKRLSKPLRSYVQRTTVRGNKVAQPTHVQVAHELAKRGRDVGEGVKIEYVVVDGSESPIKAIPAEDFKGDFDRFYLWENLIYPATQRFLHAAFPTAGGWRAWERVRPAKVPAKVAATKAALAALLPAGYLDQHPEALKVDAKPKKKRSEVTGQGKLFN